MVSEADGSGARFLAPIADTNHPLPSAAESVAWAPDGRRIAFVSATPGPEGDDANGDPMVITRYLYKPTAGEGSTRFNDNRRLHMFVVDVGTRQVTPAHRGHRLRAFDRLGAERRRDRCSCPTARPTPIASSTTTCSACRRARSRCAGSRRPRAPSTRRCGRPTARRLAFAGTRRDLTSSETTMEDTHVWVMNADGSQRVEIGAGVDNRQGEPRWSADGRQRLLHAAGARRGPAGPAAGGRRRGRPGGQGPRQRRRVGAWARAASPTRSLPPNGPSELYTLDLGATAPPERRTTLNAPLLATRAVAAGGGVPLPSADGTEIEAFLTKPLGQTADLAPSADRDDPRRSARPAGTGLQRQGAGLRRRRAGRR